MKTIFEEEYIRNYVRKNKKIFFRYEKEGQEIQENIYFENEKFILSEKEYNNWEEVDFYFKDSLL